MNSYLVKFQIDVEADSPKEAAELGWRLLSDEDALRPIAEVVDDKDNHCTEVDLSWKTT